ncbi:hypothetical protein DID88_006040 [Monilinia fructigena]|uniref:ribonuclease H n=1 Tax=Monilinia fructigena TaxID=38457 RepID=A0A395J1Y4_9HELO|nr:hypothetical protein DID88_006040 [Monilinia fructigena]
MYQKYLVRERRRDQERSDEDILTFSRKFDLHQYFSPASRNTQRFIHYDSLKGISMVHDADQMSGDPDTLVVAVNGACPDNGIQPATKSSIGVFFGPDSPFNLSEKIARPEGVLHTTNYAELMAVHNVLCLIKNSSFLSEWRTREEEKVLTAIIMTDSTNVYNSLTAWIWKWRENNFADSNGHPVS